MLRARFNDARFFWETDQKKKLADRVDDLKDVTFQAKLGSYLREDRAHRRTGAGSSAAMHRAERAALALQVRPHHRAGQRIYRTAGRGRRTLRARAGRAREVWQAIYDHYKPVSMEDSIPAHAQPARSSRWPISWIRCADCFRIGMMPTGSKDPFALRRAAQGVVKILVEGELRFPLADLVARTELRTSSKIVSASTSAMFAASSTTKSMPPWRPVARSAGSGSAPAAAADDPPHARFRATRRQLQTHQEYSSPGRVHGRRRGPRRARRSRPGKDLYDESQRIGGQPIESVIAALRPKVDLFFDKVLVNAQDPQVRQNRLALLHNLLAEFTTFADFSEIVN